MGPRAAPGAQRGTGTPGKSRPDIGLGRSEVFVATETDLFYLVLLNLFTLVVHLVLSSKTLRRYRDHKRM
jgi:hypothetical protein